MKSCAQQYLLYDGSFGDTQNEHSSRMKTVLFFVSLADKLIKSIQ